MKKTLNPLLPLLYLLILPPPYFRPLPQQSLLPPLPTSLLVPQNPPPAMEPFLIRLLATVSYRRTTDRRPTACTRRSALHPLLHRLRRMEPAQCVTSCGAQRAAARLSQPP